MKFIEFPELPEYVQDSYDQMTVQSVCGGSQPNLLYGLSSLCGEKGAIVEIGSYTGSSTIALAAAQKEKNGCKIFSVDCSLHPTIHHNLEHAGLTDWVELIQGFSHNVVRTWAKPIELLFIDGSHIYLAAKNDIDLWVPFVIEGGFVALHDYHFYNFQSVAKAVYKTFLSKPDKFRIVSDRDAGSIIVFQRLPMVKTQLNWLDKLRQRLQLRKSWLYLKNKYLNSKLD